MSSVVVAYGVRLSPSLRAATTLERRYGFQTMLDACADGRLSVIADIVEASSDCGNFLATLRSTPLIEVLPKLAEQLPSHILTLAGVDPNSDKAQQSSGETMPFADYYARLFRLGTGWLGWSPEVTWSATPKEISEAYAGHLEMLRAIYGTSEADDQPHPTQQPEHAKLDRRGLHALKRLKALPCR